jgi:DNA invertase Pin-like site-specific DNA recombinase
MYTVKGVTTMSRVYSYLRFSAAKQADGASTARQTEYARKWAEENNLVLDDSLTMRDEGLSAYHQKHITSGALGIFLEAVANGKIPTGSVLVVEGLDRLSRTEPLLAQHQLTKIILAGISVVTASDSKVYSREELKRDPMGLIYSILIMIRANEESETKSKRGAHALLRAAKAWQAGQRVTVPGGRIPTWIKRDIDGNFVLIPETAASMREAINLYLAGYGAVKILDELEKQGLAPIFTGRKKNPKGTLSNPKGSPNNLDFLFRNKSYLFLGNREMKLSGEDFLLEGYYPALIDVDTFNRLKIETEKRKKRPHTGAGKSTVPNLFSGMRICRCGVCDTLLLSNNRLLQTAQGKKVTSAPSNNAVLQPSKGEYWYRRLRCPTCQRQADPSVSREPWSTRYGNGQGSCTPDHLENAVFDFCADQFNIDSLLAGNDNGAELRKEQRAVMSDLERDEKQLSKIVKLSLEGDGDIPAVLVRQMQELEKRIANNKELERNIAVEISVRGKTKPVNAEAWRNLRAGFFAFDHSARTTARKLFGDTFSGVRVFFQAATPLSGKPAVALELTSESGEKRLLTIDRKNGELLSIERDGMRAEVVTDNDVVQVVKAKMLPTRH